MAIFSTRIRKLIHGRSGADNQSASGHTKHNEDNLSSCNVSPGNPPILIPESPLINFLSQLTPAQRLGIRNIQVTQALGYNVDRVFPDGESLYQWLTPGDRLISNFAWPAERHRKQWFRVDLTAPFVFQYAESVMGAESMKSIVGRADF